MEQKKSRKIVKCPICKNPSSTASFPFCSDRCRKVDLHRWFSGQYVIPGEERDILRAGKEGVPSASYKDPYEDEEEA